MRRAMQMRSMDSLAEEDDENDDDDHDEDDDDQYHHYHDDDEEDELPAESRMWRSVKDHGSGKTYYYHVATRESVWEKPLALCSARERAEVAWRGEQQRSFFAEMEGNIRRKIKQGLLFADAPEGTPLMPGSHLREGLEAADREEGPYMEQQRAHPAADRFCRTISTMNDSVVAELCAISPRTAPPCASPEKVMLDNFPASPHFADDTGGSSSPPGLAPLAPAWTTSCPAVLRRLGDGNKLPASAHTARDEDGAAPATSAVNASPRRNSGQASASGAGTRGLSAAGELAGKDDARVGDEWSFGFGTIDSGAMQGRAGGAGRAVRGSYHIPPHLTRRNSTSTIYLAAHDSLSDPDLDATIRCVCAVLRAHMIEAVADGRDGSGRGGQVAVSPPLASAAAAARGGSFGGYGCGGRSAGGDGGGWGGMWGSVEQGSVWRDENMTVFDDPPHTPDSSARAGGAWTRATMVPPLRVITAYYRDLYHRTRLKFDCIVLSLIYVERLMKETKGALRPQPWNWKSLVMSALVLSSKVWDDHSMWNRDFSELCPSFTLSRLNQLEVAVLAVLRFNVKVLSSEYAKYYFHLRSMCVRGGLSVDSAPMHPLDMEDVRVIEDLSSKLEQVSVGKQTRSAKAMSLHNVNDIKLLQRVAKSGYAFTDKQAPSVSLEQVVNSSVSSYI